MEFDSVSTIQRGSIITFPSFGLSLDPPASFQLFGKTIYLYGVIIAAAFIIGILYCGRKAERNGIKEDDIYDLLLWLLPFSIIGARLYFVLFNLDYYLENPSEIAAVWEGGLAIYGGVIAGALVILIFTRKKKISTLSFLDLFLTACILGQAIGRWGNFTNREAFGCQTDGFFRMGLTDLSGTTIYVHPTFLYESLWDFAGFLIMNHYISKAKKYRGQCFYIYCLWYGTGRAVIEGLRTDSLFIPGTSVRVSQLLSVILAVFGLVMLIKNRGRADQSISSADPIPDSTESGII
ncbi:MAG: prolipoprotein diacylglyceryl transferase [Eubacteriales bacterium]|nr:prolipoprotein diacylglyceryl transferase [Eubacteriales bacterium]